MYYIFQTKAEAEAKIAEITAAYFSNRPNGEWLTSKYCDVIECNEGWAVIANDVTGQFIQGTPQEITFNTPDL